MSPAHLFRATLVATLAALGCSDDPATAVPTEELAEAADLPLLFPAFTRDSRPPTEVHELEPTERPARAFTKGETDGGSDGPTIDENTMATIIGPVTSVGFTPTYAYATGRHSYIGNVGRVVTEASVSFEGTTIGVQPAERQNYTPFLFDWGEVHSIWAEAYVFTDQDCGLKVGGDSQHFAWWQWFMGGPAPKWGDANATSQAFPPAEQPPCGPPPQDSGSGGGGNGSGSDGSGSVTCWYWVTYDPATGEVYDWQLLFCEGPEEGG